MKSRIDGVATVNWILIAACGLTLNILFFALQTIISPLAVVLTQFGLPLPSFLKFMWSVYSFLNEFPGGILTLLLAGWLLWTQTRNPASERILLRNTVIFTFLLTVCITVLLIYAYEFVFTIPKATGRAFLP